jgi:hypothetical protein
MMSVRMQTDLFAQFTAPFAPEGTPDRPEKAGTFEPRNWISSMTGLK